MRVYDVAREMLIGMRYRIVILNTLLPRNTYYHGCVGGGGGSRNGSRQNGKRANREKSITFVKKILAEKRSRRNWKETHCTVDL